MDLMLFWLVPQTSDLQVDRARQILYSPGKPGLSIQDLKYKPKAVGEALAKIYLYKLIKYVQLLSKQ